MKYTGKQLEAILSLANAFGGEVMWTGNGPDDDGPAFLRLPDGAWFPIAVPGLGRFEAASADLEAAWRELRANEAEAAE